MTSILITGATGFVGSALFRDARKRDHDITIVIRKGTKERLPEGAEAATIVEVDDLFGQPYEHWNLYLPQRNGQR